jgi:hypothetical protein
VSAAGAPYETSSTYVGGLLKAFKHLGLLDDAVAARFTEEQRAIVKAPWATSWWPGPVSEGIADAVHAVHGSEALERAGYETVLRSVGPIITPLISVIGAIFGLSPSSLFERMADLSSTSIKGVGLVWRSTGPKSGVLEISYPTPMGPSIEPLWRGSCRYVFHTARADGRIDQAKVTDGVLVLTVSWA